MIAVLYGACTSFPVKPPDDTIPSEVEIPAEPELPEITETPRIPDATTVPGISELPEIADTPEISETPRIPDTAPVPGISETPHILDTAETPELLITFAGDIMAHDVNFKMKDYNMIYDELRGLLTSDNLTFGNLEAPVASSRPYETYPTFNIHGPYAQAAIDGGFDVFSLANNHTNDQGARGIQETYQWFSEKRKSGVYSAGIKNQANGPLTYEVIETNTWTILFAAVTEILNASTAKEFIDYIPPEQAYRTNFIATIRALRAAHPCDVFILGVHIYEDEYKDYISDRRKQFFHALLDAGVDIVWASHPHVMQEWEQIDTKNALINERITNKFIMYSMGNFISGQRYRIDKAHPEAPREYTGDSILMQLRLAKVQGHVYIKEIIPVLITNYVDIYGNIVVKFFTKQFIERQNTEIAAYYSKRMELMQKYQGITTVK
jgi:poly-gamma-glutamate synthesis protein (capsule biosynthesis protein)